MGHFKLMVSLAVLVIAFGCVIVWGFNAYYALAFNRNKRARR